MRLRMNNFNIMGVHRKIRFLGWVYEKTTYRGELSKGEGVGGGGWGGVAWIVCSFMGELGEKEGVVFLKGVDSPNAHYD